MAHGQRVVAIDVARGLAIAGVVLFHIVWDLEFTGIINGVARHPVWLAFGRSLAGTFMFLVGVSLVLAHRETIHVRAFTRRLFSITAYAMVITLVTWFVFPESFIFFGILHAIAAATLLGALFLRASPLVCLGAATIVLMLPFVADAPAFNTRWLAWIGFAERPPPSNDFVPIFPWVGVTLLGMASAKLFAYRREQGSLGDQPMQGWLARILVWMGNRSLPIYLVHQPILLSVIVPLSWVFSTPR
ncbi:MULTISPECIES: heparan-alpha-glucosaminide N-acetyltransferase [Chelativorans]|jgi:uncharacterized membrane protein|uniref:Heparan-alpha-glucosaminide N-acetyltransferase catalytic domain-containing protein n=1 Tax=Chelativorans sp. (strain BNC1) TaxID=266779 RepID=Q11N89_CHESB|nr:MULTISPECIES: heparan-alpha-glucosaminide N-acetyltransferase [Chelativorans]